MIRKRAHVGDTLRLLVPNTDTLSVLPPGAVLEITAHFPEQPHGCLARVRVMPAQPEEYHIIVPRGSKVNIHEE